MDFYYDVALGDRGIVYKDGKEVTHAIRCNTNHGWVERMVTPAQFDHLGNPVREVIHGNITFVRHKEFDE